MRSRGTPRHPAIADLSSCAAWLRAASGWILIAVRAAGLQVPIYQDPVAHISNTQAPSFLRALAYAIAHEFGHVLLRSDPHTQVGLMKGRHLVERWIGNAQRSE